MRHLLIAIAVWLAPAVAGATNYYVTPGGSDSNPGTSVGAALQTIQRAANLAQAGDSVLVLPGNYQGFTVKSSGTSNANRLVFKSTTQWGAVIDRSINTTWMDFIDVNSDNFVTLDGFRIDGSTRRAIAMFNTVALHVRNCYITNCFAGAQGAQNKDTVYEDNIFDANGGDALQHHLYFAAGDCPPSTPALTGLVVRRNLFTDSKVGTGSALHFVSHKPGYKHEVTIEDNVFAWNRGTGPDITALSVRNSHIRNNLFYSNNSTNGIVQISSVENWCNSDPMDSADSVRVYNNTIYGPQTKGIFLREIDAQGTMDGRGFVIFNNIVISSSVSEAIVNQSTTAQSISNNIVHGMNESGIATILNALFVDYANDDFRIKSGSAAHNTGLAGLANIDAPADDIDDISRPSGGTYDIGAYEVIEGTEAPPAPPQNVAASETSPGCVRVTWQANSETDLSGYVVYYGPQSVASGTAASYAQSRDVGNTTSADICALGAGTWYMAVRAYDATGEFSGYSAERSVVVVGPDTGAPSVVQLSPGDGATGVAVDAQVRFSLTDLQSGVDTNSVSVSIGGTAPATITYSGNPSRFDAVCRPAGAFPPNATVTVVVSVSDLASPTNTGGRTWSFTTTGIPPASPSGVTAEQTDPGCVTVAWQANSEPDLAGYRVYHGSQSVSQGAVGAYSDSVDVGTATTAREVCSLPTGTRYFAVRAYNGAGQPSGYSTERAVDVVSADVSGPDVLVVNPARDETGVLPSSRVQFALLDPGSGVDTNRVDVRIDGAAPSAVTFSGVPASVVVSCVPAGGLPATATVTVAVTVFDLATPPNSTTDNWSFTTTSVPPSAPTGLSVQGTDTGDANLSWNANGEADVAAYFIYFSNESVAFGPATAYPESIMVDALETSYTVGGLGDGTYYFALRAKNADDVLSPMSGEVSAEVTNGDTQGPLPPQALQVVETSPGCMSISWRASSEPDVVGYMVHYGQQSVAQGETQLYSASRDVRNVTAEDICSLDANTYFVAVRAYNSLGVFSAYSTEKSITVMGADVQGPALSLVYPQENSVGVPQNTKVFLLLSDAFTGVDTTSVSVFVNGDAPASLTFTGDASSQAVVCDLSQELPANSAIAVEVTASDRANPGNVTSRTWMFTTGAAPDRTPPVIEGYYPPSRAEDVDPGTEIIVQASDDNGIDQSRVALYVNGQPTPIRVEVDGAGRVTIQRESIDDLPGGTVDVVVVVYDLAGNRQDMAYDFSVSSAAVVVGALAEIVPDGYWADDPSRPLEVRNLPLGWTVRIFNTAGEEVRNFRNTDADGLTWTWNFTNDHGRAVARALYLVRVVDERGSVKHSGRFVVRAGQ
jgi:hypothetical protein